jgi:hypothetical protein
MARTLSKLSAASASYTTHGYVLLLFVLVRLGHPHAPHHVLNLATATHPRQQATAPHPRQQAPKARAFSHGRPRNQKPGSISARNSRFFVLQGRRSSVVVLDLNVSSAGATPACSSNSRRSFSNHSDAKPQARPKRLLSPIGRIPCSASTASTAAVRSCAPLLSLAAESSDHVQSRLRRKIIFSFVRLTSHPVPI